MWVKLSQRFCKERCFLCLINLDSVPIGRQFLQPRQFMQWTTDTTEAKGKRVGWPYTYQLYGLRVASALKCPELVAIRDAGEPDVIIRFGKVPLALPEPHGQGVVYQASPGQFLLHLEQIARYLVQNGNAICIEPAPYALEGEVRVFLLGSCLGALLHQRGILALHASAIHTPRGGVLFVGVSGAGTSTLLATFLQRGYPMLADDLTGVVLDSSGRPLVLPAYPQVKLWADVLPHMQVDRTALRHLSAFQRLRPPLEKYGVPHLEGFVQDPVPLSAVYVLGVHNRPELWKEPVHTVDKFDVFLQYTYREPFLDGLGRRVFHFMLANTVANAITVTRVTRPMTPVLLEELADRIEEDWR